MNNLIKKAALGQPFSFRVGSNISIFSLCWILFSCDLPVKRGVAKVIKDGDSIILEVGNRDIEVRLQGIDAPEFEQPFAEESREYLKGLILDREVELENYGIDRFGRTLAILKIGDLNVNEEMIAKGMAWHFEQFHKDRYWRRLQREAQKARIGLWELENPIPPSEWRKEKKAEENTWF